MTRPENVEMKSGDSSRNPYSKISDPDVQSVRSSQRDKAAKNIRFWVIRILGVLLILGFLILVFLVSLLFTYYKDMREEMSLLKNKDKDMREEMSLLKNNDKDMREEMSLLKNKDPYLMGKVAEIESSVKSISSDKAIGFLSRDIHMILGAFGRVTEEMHEMNNPADPKCGAGWIKYEHSCYYLSSDSLPWNDSKTDCEDRSSHLVVINGEGEMNLLRWISQDSHVWIGLSDADGTWKWVDGTSYDMTPKFWADGQPDNWEEHDLGGGEDCVEIWNSDKWNDVHCSQSYQYICEKKIS